MRIHPLSIWIVCFFIVASHATADAAEAPTLREAALEHLLSERGTHETFDAAIATARKSGVHEQAIIEARFLYHIDRREDDKIAALAPEFIKLRESFTAENSAVFGEKDDWLAVVEYVQAIAAVRKGDKAAFKTHITEAFWLSPQQAGAFASDIDRLRLNDAMDAVKFDFSIKLESLAVDQKPQTLAKIILDHKALLLHFWSPKSTECEDSLPDFAVTAESISTKGIAVASLVPNGEADTLTKSRDLIKPFSGKAAGAWLIDSDTSPLARLLRFKNVPTMVLISSDGRILFNGEPSDSEFWKALHKIDERILRPDTTKQQQRPNENK